MCTTGTGRTIPEFLTKRQISSQPNISSSVKRFNCGDGGLASPDVERMSSRRSLRAPLPRRVMLPSPEPTPRPDSGVSHWDWCFLLRPSRGGGWRGRLLEHPTAAGVFISALRGAAEKRHLTNEPSDTQMHARLYCTPAWTSTCEYVCFDYNYSSTAVIFFELPTRTHFIFCWTPGCLCKLNKCTFWNLRISLACIQHAEFMQILPQFVPSGLHVAQRHKGFTGSLRNTPNFASGTTANGVPLGCGVRQLRPGVLGVWGGGMGEFPVLRGVEGAAKFDNTDSFQTKGLASEQNSQTSKSGKRTRMMVPSLLVGGYIPKCGQTHTWMLRVFKPSAAPRWPATRPSINEPDKESQFEQHVQVSTLWPCTNAE